MVKNYILATLMLFLLLFVLQKVYIFRQIKMKPIFTQKCRRTKIKRNFKKDPIVVVVPDLPSDEMYNFHLRFSQDYVEENNLNSNCDVKCLYTNKINNETLYRADGKWN
jgi:hypothetical protein